jgi:hypothetical protein
VVRPRSVGVNVGAEEAAARAHPRDRDLAPLLELADDPRERAQEDRLLGRIERIHGGQQHVRPGSGPLRGAAAGGG